MSREEYREYLKTDIWKRKREAAIKEAHGRCRVCNDDRKLRVHHRQYPVVLGTEPASFLTVLCDRCHHVFHKRIELKNRSGRNAYERKLITSARNGGKNARELLKTKRLSGEVKHFTLEEIERYQSEVSRGT